VLWFIVIDATKVLAYFLVSPRGVDALFMADLEKTNGDARKKKHLDLAQAGGGGGVCWPCGAAAAPPAAAAASSSSSAGMRRAVSMAEESYEDLPPIVLPRRAMFRDPEVQRTLHAMKKHIAFLERRVNQLDGRSIRLSGHEESKGD
jgi:hypothetical protein